MKYCMPLLTLCLFFAACNSKPKAAKDTSEKKPATSVDNAKIRNSIDLKASGLKVKQAFLLYQDGTLVPEGNKVDVNQKVNLRLIISGWKEENGKVFLGASEKIVTNEGNVFVDEPDLFKSYETDGIAPTDAEYITLSATVTMINQLFDYFLVSFRVWDKKGSGEVTGSYKLYLK